MQRGNSNSDDHEVQAATAFLDLEGAVGNVDERAGDLRRRTGEREYGAHRQHGELLQRRRQLRQRRLGEIEECDRENEEAGDAEAERCTHCEPEERRLQRDVQILNARR